MLTVQKTKKITAVTLLFVLSVTDVAVPLAQAAEISGNNPLTPTPTEQKVTESKVIERRLVNIATTVNKLALADMGYSEASAKQPVPVSVQELASHDFEGDEVVSLTVNNPDRDKFTTKVVNAEGKEIPVEIRTVDRGGETEVLLAGTNQLVPGKFTLEVTDAQGRTSKQDFTWGVLALNTDKAVYKPGEAAFVSMAVLDDKGEMECSADVELQVISTKTKVADTYSTKNKNIIVNDDCHSKEFTLTPDYQTQFTTGGVGEYMMKLTARTIRGEHTISETFWVKDSVPFDIKRTSSTRLYPPLAYPMHIEFTANQDFEGTVTETVPESFVVTPADQNTSFDSLKTFYLNGKDPEANVLGASTASLQMPFDGGYGITQGFGGLLTDVSLRDFYSSYGLSGHDGIDFALPMGTPLYAVDDGNIVWSGPGDYGITIIIQHAWGKSYYGHLSKTDIGTNVSAKKGELIGYSGNTGESTGPHLHFGMKPENADMKNGYAGKIDPMQYLSGGNVMPLALAKAVNSTGVLSATTSAEPDTHEQDTPGGSESITPAEAAMQPEMQPKTPERSPEPESVAGVAVGSSTDVQVPAVQSEPFSVISGEIKDEIADSEMTVTEKVKVLKWKVSLKKGEKTTLSYTWKAPKISPQFYLLGSAKVFDEQKQEIFDESRKWQLAADAVGTDWYDYSYQYRKSVTVDGSKVGVQPDPWCNDNTGITCTTSWTSRKKITFNNSASATDLTNFPVLIKLNSNRIDYADTQADGDDLRFVDPSDPNTALAQEVEEFNETGDDFVWVKVPQIDAGSKTDYIWMYYNNVSATSGNDAANVWDSNYRNVYHMQGTSGSAVIADSATGTGGTENGAKESGTGAGQPANTTSGKIGDAQDFNRATTDYIQITGFLGNPTNLTMTGWFNLDSSDSFSAEFFSLGDYTQIKIDADPGGTPYIEGSFYNAGARSTSADVEYAGTGWHYVAYIVDDTGNTQSLYVDNVLIASSAHTQTPAYTGLASSNTQMGRHGYQFAEPRYFDGRMDEMRLSTSARSADWVEADYLTQTDAMNTFGTEEAQTPSTPAWCNDVTGITCTTSWNSRKEITFISPASTLANFPVLIKLNAGTIDYAKTQVDADDLRFVDASDHNTVLAHEVELWDEAGDSYVWVKVPSLAGTTNSDSIWMYYDNASATSGQDPSNVWDGSYEIVQHLNDGNVSTTNDSTANGNDGTKIVSASQPSNHTAGQVGPAMDFAGGTAGNTGITIPGSAASVLDLTDTDHTFASWVNKDSLPASGGLTDYAITGRRGNYVGTSLANNPQILGTTRSTTTAFNANSGTATYSNGTWYYVVQTVDDTAKLISLYINGVLVDTTTYTGTLRNFASTDQYMIGRADPSTACNLSFAWCMDGKIDEVRVSSDNRTADWIRAEYVTMTDAMNTFGQEQSYVVSLTDYPVLISLTSDTDLSSKAQADGDDILFTSSDGLTKLSHEIESYTSGTLVAWVKVPTLTNASNVELYMYYGNPAASSQQAATSVWDSNFRSVFHLKEVGNGTAGEFDESTSNNDNGRGGEGTSTKVPTRTTGKIGFGQDFDGTDDYIAGTNTSLISGTAAYTYSAWVNADSCGEGGNGTVMGKDNVSNIYLCEVFTDNFALFYESNGTSAYSADNSIAFGSWYYIVAVYNDGGTASFYVNGVSVPGADLSVTETDTTGVISLGAESSGGGALTNSGFNYAGLMDETRISNVVRSSNWIATDYTNQNTPSTFYAVGAEETEIYAPVNSELMRHGKFFDSRAAEQPFNF